MGLAFPLQNLMAAYGPVGPINDWIFQKPGATIDTPTNLTAALHLEQWIKNGYFPPDINAIEYTDANARFGKGEGVFIFNGDWQNAGYDKDIAGNVRFFLMPSAWKATCGNTRRRSKESGSSPKRSISRAIRPRWYWNGSSCPGINSARPSLYHSTQISMLLSGLIGFTNSGRNLFAFFSPKHI